MASRRKANRLTVLTAQYDNATRLQPAAGGVFCQLRANGPTTSVSDEAISDGQFLYVRTGTRLLKVSVSVNNAPSFTESIALARLGLGRLATRDACS